MWLSPFTIALTGFIWLASTVTASGDEPLTRDYAAATAALAPHLILEGQPDSSAEATRLLKQLWSLTERAAIEYLNDHPDTTPEDLVSAVEMLCDCLEVQVLPLGPSAFLVTTQAEDTSEENRAFTTMAFVLARHAARYEAVWDPPSPVAGKFKDPNFFIDWMTPGNILSFDIVLLPNDAYGKHRFYINARRSGQGGTQTQYLAVFSYEKEKINVLNTTEWVLQGNVDTGASAPIYFDGKYIHLDARKEYASFHRNFGEQARAVDWRILVAPDGVHDAGQIAREPAVDVIDRLYDRALHGKDLRDIAAPAVIALVRTEVATVPRFRPTWSDPSVLTLGDGFWQVRRKGPHAQVCFWTDSGSWLFTIDMARRVSFVDRMVRAWEAVDTLGAPCANATNLP